MRTEAVAQRMALLARLLERSSIDPRHHVPLPGGKPRRGFTHRQVATAWRRLAQNLANGLYTGHFYNLYLHLPFCPSACSFCLYDHEVASDEGAVRAYLRALRRQLDGMSGVVGEASFQNLLVGGGTPTWLDGQHLAAVLDAVLASFRLAPDAAKVLEANPGDVTAELAALVRGAGIDIVSVGVHSLDPAVLDRHGRGFQQSEQVEAAIGHLRDAGMPWVECDVLVGLHGDSATSLARTVEQLMRWQPDGITLTRLRPKRSYLERHWGGDDEAFRAHYLALFARLVELGPLAADHGFDADDLAADELSWRLRRRGRVRPGDERRPYAGPGGPVPASTLGLGRFAHSKICGELLAEHRAALPSVEPDAATYFGVEATLPYEAARFVAYHLVRHGTVDDQRFRRLFGVGLRESYGHLLDELAELGELRVETDRIEVGATGASPRFVVSRLFLDRQTAVEELSMDDWEVLHIFAGQHRLRVRVDHLRADRPSYFALAGSVGLLLERSTAPGSARERVLLGVLAALLRRVARSRPWLAALEVADWLAAELPGAVAPRLTVTVAVGDESPRH